MAGLAAVLLTARIGSTPPDIATGWELELITMVVLGGVSVMDGSGTIPGVFIAVFLMGLVTFGMGLLNVPAINMAIVIGCLLISAIATPILMRRLGRRLGKRGEQRATASRCRSSRTSMPEEPAADYAALADGSAHSFSPPLRLGLNLGPLGLLEIAALSRPIRRVIDILKYPRYWPWRPLDAPHLARHARAGCCKRRDGMKLGLYLRNMGPQSTRGLIADAARAAEEAGIDDLWVADHLALAPEESHGSDGRYLEPLATLAFLAGITERVGLAVGVLIVPYRPALLTAKWVASIQELSGNRLVLGVGVGWMEQEFRALGVDPRRRGAITDATLAFLHACFAADEVLANGQTFLFRPRPPRPPILVGGAPPHAIRRAVRFGEGWMPTAAHGEVLEAGIASLRDGMAAADKPAPEIVLLQPLPVEDDEALGSRLGELQALGITRVVHPWRYRDAEEVARVAARLVAARDA